MHISEIQLHNYKSYPEAALSLTPGFNIITGQNNSGKTALLEAVGLTLTNKPHRSLRSLPTSMTRPIPESWANVSLTLSGKELYDLLVFPDTNLYVPVPHPDSELHKQLGLQEDPKDKLPAMMDWLFGQEAHALRLRYSQEGLKAQSNLSFDSYQAQYSDNNAVFCWTVHVGPDRSFSTSVVGNVSPLPSVDLGLRVATELRNRIFSFRAERMNISRCRVGTQTLLLPGAQNLPEVLSNLQGGNPARFQRFNERIREVLPQIRQVCVQNVDSQEVEILVWTEDPASERQDLAIPLSESGTGIGQVLAILYVVLNSDFPRVIVIDEPQSFLHPGAVRKLIAILKANPQHQYIIATHSPTVITAVEPSTITLVRQQGAASSLQVVDPQENEQLREYLAEIGARLSDVFGADNILWVEGETEEQCFPMIVSRIGRRQLMGTAIVGVRNTGDLEGKHAEAVFEIYQRLCRGHGLLPPAVGFLFDQEGRSSREQESLIRRSHGAMTFLPRRLYENYLLDARAIAGLINSIEGFDGTNTTAETILNRLQQMALDPRYYRPLGLPDLAGGADWRLTIHGAHVLEELFRELSEGRVEYRKLDHSLALTRWLLDNEPGELQELADLICDRIERGEEPHEPDSAAT